MTLLGRKYFVQPCHDGFWGLNAGPRLNDRALNHQQGGLGVACRDNLRRNIVPARIFTHHKINSVIAHYRLFCFNIIRPSVLNKCQIGQIWQGIRQVYDAGNISVQWDLFKQRQRLAAHCQKNSLWALLAQKVYSSVKGGHLMPMIPRNGYPSGTFQGQQGQSAGLTGVDCILAHVCGKGMGGINDRFKGLGLQKVDQPVNATKTSNARWYWLAHGFLRASCIRQQRVKRAICQKVSKATGFGGSAQQKDLWGQRGCFWRMEHG